MPGVLVCGKRSGLVDTVGGMADAVRQDVPAVKLDPLGVQYDSVYTDSQGTTHYERDHAQGRGGGPAFWSDERDCNPSCGCHLSAKCTGCQVCMNCDGCYCFED